MTSLAQDTLNAWNWFYDLPATSKTNAAPKYLEYTAPEPTLTEAKNFVKALADSIVPKVFKEGHPRIGDPIRTDKPELGVIGNDTKLGDVCPDACQMCPYITPLSEPEALESKFQNFNDTFMNKDWLIATTFSDLGNAAQNSDVAAAYRWLKQDQQQPDITDIFPTFVNSNVCGSDQFRMAGPELTNGATTWNQNFNYSNYCCPNPIGSDQCPFFRDKDDYYTNSDGEPDAKNQISISQCYRSLPHRNTDTNGGIDCGRKDGTSPYERVTSTIDENKVFIDAKRPRGPLSRGNAGRPIETQYKNKETYYGTRFVFNVDQPYNYQYQDKSTGYDYYEDPIPAEELEYGLCKNNETYDIKSDINNSNDCAIHGPDGYTWDPAPPNFFNLDDTKIHNFINARDKLSCDWSCWYLYEGTQKCECDPVSKSRFTQLHYDNEFCSKINQENEVNQEGEPEMYTKNPNKFYRIASFDRKSPVITEPISNQISSAFSILSQQISENYIILMMSILDLKRFQIMSMI